MISNNLNFKFFKEASWSVSVCVDPEDHFSHNEAHVTSSCRLYINPGAPFPFI